MNRSNQNGAPIRSADKRNWVLRILGSAACSAGVIALLLHLVPSDEGKPLEQLGSTLGSVVWYWMLIYLALQLGQTLVRAIRYRLLLQAAGEPSVPRLRQMTLVTLTRNMLVDLLPARAGELAYIAMLNRGYRVSGRACFSSLAISFIFDMVALGVVFSGVLLFHLGIPGSEDGRLLSMVTGLFLLVPGLALAALYASPEWHARWAVLQPRPAGDGIGHKILVFIRDVTEAVRQTRLSGTFLATLGLSTTVRLLKYGGLYAAFRAVTDVQYADLAAGPLHHIMLAFMASEATASMPAPLLMSFGSYEAGGTSALTALGFPAADALICMTALHVATQLVDYTLGGIGLLIFTLTAGRRAEPTR